MKTRPHSCGLPRFFIKALTAVGAFCCAATLQAKVFDGGVDSANLGKGDWIYYVSQATNKLGGAVNSVTNIPSLMSFEKSKGMEYIIVKAGTGSTNFEGGGTSPQFNAELINAAHAAGLKIFAYTRSYGDDIPGEVAMAADCYNLGADGFVFDSESEWESGHQGTLGPTNAWKMLSQVKTNFPTKFLGHAPFPYISLHSSFPYKEYGYWCDAVMPQCYWNSIGVTPQQMVDDLDSEWRSWQNGLTGQWTNSVKPIVPIGQADTSLVPGTEITDFVNAVKNTKNPATSGGYQGINWWRADLHTSAQWTSIGNGNVGNAMGTVNDIIMDNISATFVGTWSSGTSSTDKYATDYRYKGQGTGASYAQFKPSIWTGGNYQVYEWHPAGSNRASDAPHVITYTGGSTTINVNQQLNGGAWNLLGTFNMAKGTGAKHVRVTDNIATSGQLAMADGIKFVYVAPAAPTKPTGFTATGTSSTSITLSWTDVATEQWYVIGRSTTSGGPYTDLIAAEDATSFVDAGLDPNTTYFYVIRAVNAGGSSANTAQASASTLTEIILDNTDATMVGTWTLASSSTDKYGADYRYKGSGTGTAYLQYTPTITVPGDYEVYAWYPQGSNRTTNAPYVINYNGGSATVRVNQKVNGGVWNLLGTFNFATGTSGNVKIQDNFADSTQLVMADAVRFVSTGGAPPVNPPAAPSGLTATAVSSSQINLSWTDNSADEDNFIVARSTTSGGPYTDIATLGANVTTFNNTGLAANTTYYYVVRASNSGGASANSAQASATTQQIAAPAAPSGLTATTVSSSQINLSWTDNSTTEANFIVGRSTTSGGPYTDIATLGANVTSFSNTGLSANTTYYYVVRASNAGGSSANSAQASATTLPNPPAAPSGLAASTVSQTQINLSWTDNSANEVNFIVARSTTAGGPYTDIATLGANVTAYNNTGLSANTTYYYVVRASNTGGSSANSAEANATTLPNAPAAPSGLTATAAGSTQIDLSWTDNSGNETSFIVARSSVSGGPYTDIATLGADSTSYSDTGLTAGATYYYVVRASNAGGSSANSAQASATTSTVPNAPSGLTATAIRATRIDLAWTDNSTDESSFIIARSATPGGPYTDIATLAANTTTYNNNSGLTANTTYYYVVRASNAAGSSANTAEANATTYETDLLIDNKSAVVVGTWSTGTASTDKYGTDYRFIGQGTGANSLKFTPWIATAGTYQVYEWHTQGANRTTNAPYVINYNGGSQTVSVNQEVNGGAWNLLGTFNFASGKVGSIQITDGFTDSAASQVVIADAIKLIFAPPPAAPSGLTATAASSSQINLNWADNSTDEDNFIVARSTTVGGPYTDVGVLSANSTSYSDTGLSANTTYYYVVRSRNSSGSSANSNEASATTLPNQTTVTFTSVATQDGYVLESGETTGVGGTATSNGSNTGGLRVGDDATDKQLKSFVSFDTSSIPDGATIVSVTLKLKRGTVVGTNPFTTHGSCFVDIKGGTGFNGATTLAIGDFQAAADATQVATMSNPLVDGDWSTGTVNATGRGFVNKTGTTQFRVYFSTDDNDDLGADYVGFYPGDNATAANRPVLEVVYQ